jgi:hypothetical protein
VGRAKTACSAGRPVLVIDPQYLGGIAQLVERLVRNEKVRGSNPLTSTILILNGLQNLKAKYQHYVTTEREDMCGCLRVFKNRGY